MSDQYQEMHERITAGRLLTTTAGQISMHLDSFCSWLLLGVGGAYALIFSSFESLEYLISSSSLQVSLLLLLVAIVLGVFQRWLAAIVAASVATSAKAEQIGKDLAERNLEVDFKVIFREVERGTYFPAKLMARCSFKKALDGDFAASGRIAAAIAQIQSLLAFVLVGFVVAAIAVTVFGLKT